MNTKQKLILLSFLLCHLSPGIAAGEINLGVAAPLSGPYEPYGTPTLRAATLVVSAINSDGGIDGETVTIRPENDLCTSNQATIAANALISAGVDVVLGHICSNATLAGLQVYNPANIPVMSPSSSNKDLTYSGTYPLFFRTILPDHLRADTMVQYSIYELRAEKFGLVHDEGTYGIELIGFVNDALGQEANRTVVFTRDSSSISVQSIVNEAINTGVEIIIFGGSDSNAALLLNELRNQAPGINFMAGEGVLTDAFLSLTGTNSNGVLIANFGETSEKYLEQKARDEHFDEYDEEPGPYFMSAYAAAYSLLMAIDNANSTDPAQIKSKLLSEDYVTPIGEISFDDRGDVENIHYSIYEIENGEAQEAFDGTFTAFQVKEIIMHETQRWDYNQNEVNDMADVLNGLRVNSGYTD